MGLLKVGVRYCGGCNPTYERVAALEGIFKELEGKAQAAGYREEGLEALLVVCGCPTACPVQEGLPPGLPVFVLRKEDEVVEALRWILELAEAENIQSKAGLIKGGMSLPKGK